MDPAGAVLPEAVWSIVEALLIGFLIGAQREFSHPERHAGVRDFILIGLVGAVCGLLQNPWLTVAALLSITALLGIFYFQVKERTGITTEIAAVATFSLCFLTATPDNPLGAPLAIGTAIAVVAFLEAKRAIHRFIRETITEREFNDTLRFLAIIFIIYPILPDGGFGPYQALEPKKIWLFVILVSSISYAGYFCEKFLGASRGLKYTGVFGGLASTTAATASFARSCSEEPRKMPQYAQAAVIANAIQFPRVLAILAVVSPTLALGVLYPLAAMSAAGLLLGLVMGRGGSRPDPTPEMKLGNPFRLLPALKFGVLFGVILFATRAASTLLGEQAVYWTSALGGSLDADAVAVSLSDLVEGEQIAASAAVAAILLALLTNALIKSIIAVYAGTANFAWRVAGGFAVMFSVGVAVWLLSRGG